MAHARVWIVPEDLVKSMCRRVLSSAVASSILAVSGCGSDTKGWTVGIGGAPDASGTPSADAAGGNAMHVSVATGWVPGYR
jgi:hypothetical protein